MVHKRQLEIKKAKAKQRNNKQQSQNTQREIKIINDYRPLPLNPVQQMISSSHKTLEPHCQICGDTHDQCPLVRFEGTDRYLCETCYDYQRNMFP